MASDSHAACTYRVGCSTLGCVAWCARQLPAHGWLTAATLRHTVAQCMGGGVEAAGVDKVYSLWWLDGSTTAVEVLEASFHLCIEQDDE